MDRVKDKNIELMEELLMSKKNCEFFENRSSPLSPITPDKQKGEGILVSKSTIRNKKIIIIGGRYALQNKSQEGFFNMKTNTSKQGAC